MAENRTYIISKTLNGDTLYYIARNKNGNVFARELTMEKLEKSIKAYKEPHSIVINTNGEEEQLEKPKEKKYLINSLLGKVQKARKRKQEETPPAEEPIPAAPKQLKNKLQAQVAERRKGSKKLSFFDRLK